MEPGPCEDPRERTSRKREGPGSDGENLGVFDEAGS